MKYNLYEDPGHGWLRVTRQELQKLGIIDKISKYSYQKGDYVYLEEDCDMSIFLEAKEARNEPVEYREHCTNNNSFIRTYQSFSYKMQCSGT